MRENTLMAQRFDPNQLALSGDPFQVAENVATNPINGSAGFTAAGNALAYRTGGAGQGRRLTWLSRSGAVEGTVSTPAAYSNVDVDPAGKRLAVFKPDGGGDLWIIDLERGTNTRFTFDPASDRTPVWSPDGAQIAFTSDRNGGVTNIYAKASTLIGEERLLFESPHNKLVTDWSPDGRYLLYEETDPKTKSDIWALPLFGDRRPIRGGVLARRAMDRVRVGRERRVVPGVRARLPGASRQVADLHRGARHIPSLEPRREGAVLRRVGRADGRGGEWSRSRRRIPGRNPSRAVHGAAGDRCAQLRRLTRRTTLPGHHRGSRNQQRPHRRRAQLDVWNRSLTS
jgi:hypothetical protein